MTVASSQQHQQVEGHGALADQHCEISDGACDPLILLSQATGSTHLMYSSTFIHTLSVGVVSPLSINTKRDTNTLKDVNTNNTFFGKNRSQRVSSSCVGLIPTSGDSGGPPSTLHID